MTYTGKTQVGSPPQTRDLGNLRVTKMAVGPLDNNAYLLQATDGSVLLIDAAAESDTLLTQLPDGRLEAVITTHSHGDHWGALGDVVAATGARTYAGAADAEAVGAQIAVPLSDGDHIDFGDATLTIIALRGHTPGGIAVHVSAADGANHIFSGDSLFPGGVGRTTQETFDQLLGDVSTRLFDRFDDETWIYPGHGWDTTLGAERPHLAEWRERGW